MVPYYTFHVCFIAALVFCHVDANFSHRTKFLYDFFRGKECSIEAYFCPSDNENISLVKALWKLNKSVVFGGETLVEQKASPLLNKFYVVDFSCAKGENVLLEASKKLYLRKPGRWLLLNPNIEKLPYIPPACELTIANITEEDVQTYQIYEIKAGMGIIYEPSGKWNYANGFIENKEMLKAIPSRRSNLMNATMRVVAVRLAKTTSEHMRDFVEPQIDRPFKQSYSISYDVVDSLNASQTLAVTNSWGYKNRKGAYSGATGYLVRDEADLGGTMFSFFGNRHEATDYLRSVVKTDGAFFFKKVPLSTTSNIFALPFDVKVWISIVAMISLLTIAIYLSESISFGDICVATIGAVSQQGSPIEFVKPSSRISFFFLMIGVSFLYVSYSAIIVVLLQSTTKIDSLQGFLNSPLKGGLENIAYTHLVIQLETERIRKRIYSEKVGPKGFYTLETGMEKIRNDTFAFHTEYVSGADYMMKHFGETERCNVKVVGKFMQFIGLYTLAQKHSPFREILKTRYAAADERGIQNRYLTRYYKSTSCRPMSSVESVGLVDAKPAFILMGSGLFVSTAILFIEILTKQKAFKKLTALIYRQIRMSTEIIT